MPLKSPYPLLNIPKCNVASYLFPNTTTPSSNPIWLDSADPANNLSPKDLVHYVKRLALGLDRLGVKEQEVVMIHTPNHIFVPVAYLGIVASKRIFSGANPAYTVPEMVHQIKNTGATVILVHPSLLKTTSAAAQQAGFPQDRLFQFSDQPNQPVSGVQDWREMIATPEATVGYAWPEMTPSEASTTVATVNYSSGTTGLPKGVCISHANLIANLDQAIYTKYLHKGHGPHDHPPERWVGFLPLYHAYGQLWTILLATKLDVPVYVMKAFQYADFLRVIQTYRITHLHTAPPILVMLSKRPETAQYDLSSVTDVLCGAAPLAKELQNDIMRRFNCQVNQGWGMTEVTCGALHVPGGIKDDSGSVGQLNPNTEARLVDEEGREVAEGEPGELYVRGPQVCLRYWKNEAATRESLSEDGWLKTGDVAVCRKDWFWIVDRKKELIKVNALQVAPAELEAVLLEHDDIADAAAVGITLHGEEWPRAYVALKDHAKGKVSERDIQDWMKQRVAKHKQLVGGVVFIDEVPKLASGKIMRKILKEWSKRDAPIMEGKVKARL